MIINTADRLKNIQEYYFSVKLQEVRKLAGQGFDIVNMGIGSPDLPPSSSTIDALCEAASKPGVHGYQPYRGIAPLRKAMAAWYKRVYGVTLDPETEIIPLMGSKEGITHISLAFLNAGDEVLIPELGYPTYASVTQMVGAIPRYYPLKPRSWGPDFEAMKKEDYSKAKLMWINYPHMPTGASPDERLFENIVEFALNRRMLVCHDNPYSLILNNQPPMSLLSINGSKECCIELNSMSKSHNMAGWRIGWINGAQDYLDQIIKVKSNFDSGMFYGFQMAAVKAFENDDQWHRDQNKVYAERRKAVTEFINLLNCAYDPNQTGMFVWAKLPDQVQSVEKFVDYMLYEKHLFITPGFIFGEAGRRYIRISLCNPVGVILKAVERIKEIDLAKLGL